MAPLFWILALIQMAAVASRFDLLAAELPAGTAAAVMLAVVPLLVLAGYFEGQIEYGPTLAKLPLWMQIKSVPVKLAFTFGFIYLACVSLQTFHISIGPLDPSPPASFPASKRALWFAMFTGGMFFPFYLAAAGLLIPVLRTVTAPLRVLPRALGALVALVLGGALGVIVLSACTSKGLTAFVSGVYTAYRASPSRVLAVGLTLTLGPMLLGLVKTREERAS